MLISTKSGAPEKDRNASVSAAEVTGRVVPHDQTWARSEPTTKAGTASCIGSDMSIVGKIDCNGGDIFHRSLSIDENSQFEGSSRRVENPTDPSSDIDAKGPQKKDMQSPAPAQLPSIDADLQRVEGFGTQ